MHYRRIKNAIYNRQKKGIEIRSSRLEDRIYRGTGDRSGRRKVMSLHIHNGDSKGRIIPAFPQIIDTDYQRRQKDKRRYADTSQIS
jgi:hypothetical protein